MKKTMIMCILIIALFGCKKDKDFTGETIDVTLNTKIIRYDNYKSSTLLDSVRFDFFHSINDSVPFVTKYSSYDGIVTVTLNKETTYYLRTLSMTYRDSGNANEHYYTYSTYYKSTLEVKKNVFIPDNTTIYFHYPVLGKGCTKTIYIDPTTY